MNFIRIKDTVINLDYVLALEATNNACCTLVTFRNGASYTSSLTIYMHIDDVYKEIKKHLLNNN